MGYGRSITIKIVIYVNGCLTHPTTAFKLLFIVTLLQSYSLSLKAIVSTSPKLATPNYEL